jgi:NADH-quinone oxidoreductase subunit J
MDVVIQIVFLVISAIIIGAAMMVVTVRDVIHSALWLISSFFGVAALYMLMEAEFIAVVQVLVYVGAISVLVLFAIMLTQHQQDDYAGSFIPRWWLAAIVVIALFGGLLVPTLAVQEYNVPPTSPDQATAIAGTAELGRGFVREYFLQFQLAGTLLLVALIGAIVIAYEERKQRRRIPTLAQELELRKRRAQRRSGDEVPAGSPQPAPASLED